MAKKTTIIVGAGASCEYELPVGGELKNQIANLFSGQIDENISNDGVINRALHDYALGMSGSNLDAEKKALRDAANLICKSMPIAPSIDNFMHVHSEDDRVKICGKLAIAKLIIDAERNSLLYRYSHSGELQLHALESRWLNNFFSTFFGDCGKQELVERLESINFIIFNYDRCVEYYLFHAIKIYYGLTDNEAGKLCESIRIFHPYGVIGKLHWQSHEDRLDFGSDIDHEALLIASERIKTFTEGTDSNLSEINKIRDAIDGSEVVVFLGFSFMPLNVELLSTASIENRKAKAEVFATALGISGSNCLKIRRRLTEQLGWRFSNIELRNNLRCAEIFNEFSRSISFAALIDLHQ